MSISVIVSNLNGARFLPKLLKSLSEQRGVNLQIIVVDRESKDESAQILARRPNVEVISEPPESGLVAGYAVGARSARHEHLFFSNEDMWFSTDCLRLLEEQFSAVERVGAVMPFQLSYDGTRMVNGGTWSPAAVVVRDALTPSGPPWGGTYFSRDHRGNQRRRLHAVS